MKRITQYRILQALSHTALSARVLMVAVLAGVLTLACDVHGITAPGILTRMTVTPDATLTVGATQQMTAVGYDSDGHVVPVSPTWTVAAGGGTIASTGIFTAGATMGLFAHTVVASVGSISANASITVIPGALATIVVMPTPVTLAVTSTQQFIAVGYDALGNIVQVTPTWSVVNSTAGSINGSTGLFIAGTVPGTYLSTVQATSGAISGFATVNVATGALATITVSPNPSNLSINGTQTFTAVGKDVNGNIVGIVPAWTVVNATAGIINGGTGLFTAGTVPGAYTNTVKATSGAISGFATVNVAVGPLFSITVSPNPSNLSTGGTQPFTAVGKDAGNNVVVIVPFWSVVNPTAGGINSGTGFFTAGSVNGTYTNTVQATSGAVSGFATVIIAAPAAPLVNFGTAAINGIMAGTSVTCSGTGVIQATSGTANISISPGSTINGFPPCVFSGTTHLGDAIALADQNILTAAYNTLAGQPCPAANNFGTIDLNGKTLPAGVYCSGTSQLVTGTLTLDGGGDQNATFVFQAGSTLTTNGANLVLINGAKPQNVYWQVGSSATLNASAWQGNIVALTSITLNVNSTLLGRALARNGSVTMDAAHNVITLP